MVTPPYQPSPGLDRLRPPGPRRAVVALVAGVLTVALVLLVGVVAALLWSWGRVDTVGAVTVERPLQVPPLAGSTVAADGTRHFDLTLQTGRSDLSGHGPTGTWGVDGPHLAPTLRATRGSGCGWT